MAIFKLSAEFTCPDDRTWQAYWCVRAHGFESAIEKGKRQLGVLDMDCHRIRAIKSSVQLGTIGIKGYTGSIPMVEVVKVQSEDMRHEYAHDRRMYMVNGQWTTSSDLAPSEYEYLITHIWNEGL